MGSERPTDEGVVVVVVERACGARGDAPAVTGSPMTAIAAKERALIPRAIDRVLVMSDLLS